MFSSATFGFAVYDYIMLSEFRARSLAFYQGAMLRARAASLAPLQYVSPKRDAP